MNPSIVELSRSRTRRQEKHEVANRSSVALLLFVWLPMDELHWPAYSALASVDAMPANKNANSVRGVFVGEHGIRPGWRFAALVVLYYLSNLILEYVLPKVHFPNWEMNWFGMVTNEWLNFAIIALLTWAMCHVDHTPFSSHGLRISHGWFGLFGQGIVWGIVPSIVILIPIWLAGGCSFHGLALSRGRLIGYATAWALAFLGVGFAEEFTFRGYAL